MRRVPQNIRNYFTNYAQRLTPTTVPMDSKQLGNVLRNARNQFVSQNTAVMLNHATPSRDQLCKIKAESQNTAVINNHAPLIVQIHRKMDTQEKIRRTIIGLTFIICLSRGKEKK